VMTAVGGTDRPNPATNFLFGNTILHYLVTP
jgi:hypothetical protein